MKLAILIPVFNDWVSCRVLLGRIDQLALSGIARLRVVLVDDGSSLPAPPDLCHELGGRQIAEVWLVDLACNVGHQRAIALGLAMIARGDADEHVLIMDADGEDDPTDIAGLVAAIEVNRYSIIVAGRTARSEGAGFRIGYKAYQLLFKLLIGRTMDFGNFSLFAPAVLIRLVHMPETWNHLAATLLRCRVPLVKLPTRRGQRYAGRSTMNLPALIAHGLSAFAVFSDHVFARLLLLSCGIGVLSVIGAAAVIYVRLATDLATPGWATTVVGGCVILFAQTTLVTLVASLQMLATRSQPGAQPNVLATLYVRQMRALALGGVLSQRQQARGSAPHPVRGQSSS